MLHINTRGKINLLLASIMVLMASACSKNSQQEAETSGQEAISATWLGKDLEESQLHSMINTYHIFDSTNTHVGKMVFGLRRDGDFWIAEDTSQLFDGSIYETAQMIYDLNSGALNNLDMDILLPDVDIEIDLSTEQEKIMGTYNVNRDTAQLVNRQIDSAYVYQAFREEVYMLLHATTFKAGDNVDFNMFFPNGFQVVNSSITHERSETVEVPAGVYASEVVYLNTGGLLDNRIWVSKEEKRRIVRYEVPSAGLDIRLISTDWI